MRPQQKDFYWAGGNRVFIGSGRDGVNEADGEDREREDGCGSAVNWQSESISLYSTG